MPKMLGLRVVGALFCMLVAFLICVHMVSFNLGILTEFTAASEKSEEYTVTKPRNTLTNDQAVKVMFDALVEEEIAHLPEGLANLIRSARQLKVFVPPFIQKQMNQTYYAALHPGIKFINDEKDPAILAKVTDWFWVHNEYLAPNYLMRRIHQNTQMFTFNLSEADLCVKSCFIEVEFVPDPHDKLGGFQHRYPDFEVVPGSEWKFSGCTKLRLVAEGDFSECVSPVPYFHSIYSPRIGALPPWNINANRKTLLCFIGSWRRGPCIIKPNQTCDETRIRHHVLKSMMMMSEAANQSARDAGTRTLFSAESPAWWAPVKDKAFFARAWALYADSVFSWQPAGDTPTRRAFYDSWMLGCIPVISAGAAKHTYGNIFRGRAFALAGLAPEDVIMVLPDEVMLSGEMLLDRLRQVPEAEIVLRRRHLRSLAPLMQWGWEAEGDALTMAFASVMTLPAAASTVG